MKPHDSDVPEDEEDEPQKEGRGRSEKRRAAASFDVLAMELTELPKHRCKGLPVTAKLKAALELTRSTVSKPARRRHLRHLSGLLRDSELEVAAIQAFLAGEAYVPVKGDEDYRDLAAMREALCDPATFAEALESACQSLPHIDAILVQRLATDWHSTQDDKSYRALYKELNRALEEGDDDEDSADD